MPTDPSSELAATPAADNNAETDGSAATKGDVEAQAFEALFTAFPLAESRRVSHQERKSKELQSLSFVYGEVAFAPFRGVLDVLKRWFHVLTRPGGVFLDLGSGSGKAVFAAALAHDFDAVYGIEALEGLHAISLRALAVWDKRIKGEFHLSQLKKRTRVVLALGDAAAGEWPNGAAAADVVFVNSTCFSERLRRDLASRIALSCKAGAIVITATHPLPGAGPTGSFELLKEMTVTQEQWGDATWFIHRKK